MRTVLFIVLVIGLGLPLAGTAVAQPQAVQIDAAVDQTAVIPPAQTHHFGREIAQTMHFTGAPWLVRESRQREEDCRTMLQALGVKPGQTVCDMGCGNGFYTLQLAQLVGPRGRVYAVDIQPERLQMLARNAAEARLANIRPVLGTPIDPRLPAGAIDMMLCVDVYHEFDFPYEMIENMIKGLKSGGRIVFVEYRKEDPLVPIKEVHKMSEEQVKKEMVTHPALEFSETIISLPRQHIIIFKKK